MSKQKMLAARELINEKRYAEARTLLKTIDDPKAKEWLKKLDQIAPEKKKSGRKPVFIAVGLLVIMIIVIVAAFILQQSNSNASNQNMISAIPTQAEFPSETNSTPTIDQPDSSIAITVDPTALAQQRREVVITCMRVAEITEQECQEIAGFALSVYPEQIDYCYSQYSAYSDIFSQCIQERVWDDMEQVVQYRRALFTGCTFKYRTDQTITSFDFTYSPEVEQGCYEWGWSNELFADPDYRLSVDTCWETYDPFNFYTNGRDGGPIDQSLLWMQDFAECVSNTTMVMPALSPATPLPVTAANFTFPTLTPRLGEVFLPADLQTEIELQETHVPIPTLNTTTLARSRALQETTTALPSNCIPYVLQEGDTPFGIAFQYGVDFDEILAVNGLTEETASFLQIGQVLIVPLPGCILTASQTSFQLTPLPPTATDFVFPTDTPIPILDQTELAATQNAIGLAQTATALAPPAR